MSKEIAKELLNLTNDKPHIIDISNPRDIDYLEVVENYKQFFTKTDEAIFSWSMIDKFWELEVKSQFRSGVKKIKQNVFFNKAIRSFNNKYNLNYPYLAGPDVGLLLEANLAVPPEECPTDRIKLPPNYMISYEYVSKKETQAISYPLYYGIYKALLYTENYQLQLDELTHIVNTEEMLFSPKLNFPLDAKTIYNEVIKHSNYFDFDKKNLFLLEFNEIIKLNDFLDPIIEHFENNRIDYPNIQELDEESGLLGIIFKGKKFPLNDADEYVKIRSILELKEVSSFNEASKSIYSTNSVADTLLSAIIDSDIDLTNNQEGIDKYNNWVRENISLSFYPTSLSEAKFYKFCLNLKLSPVLEIGFPFENIYRKNIAEIYMQFKNKLGSGNGQTE